LTVRRFAYYASAVITGLALSALLIAADPPTEVVEVPSPMPAAWKDVRTVSGKLVKVKTANDLPARWVLIDDVNADLAVAADGKTASFVAREAGTYKALVWGEKGDPGRLRFIVDGGSPVPPVPKPEPGPGPGPNPPPGPVGAVKSFVVVEDTSKPGTFRGDILGSTKVQGAYKSLGLTHRLIDANSAPATLDDAGQKYQAAAKASGIEPPVLITLDGPLGTGKVIQTVACPKDVDGFCGAIGQAVHERKMGLIFPEGGKLKAKWNEFGASASVPLIDRAKWRDVNYENFLPPVYDQDGIGQCASSSACTLLETGRAIAGMPHVHFSAGDLYSRVNGGRDDGSMLEDNMAELVKNGACEASLVPYVWDHRSHNTPAVVANRAKYKVVEVYTCPTFDALVSALQQGFVGQEGLLWYPNYKPDSSGWLPRGVGRPGGHALMAYGAVKNPHTGEWGILTRNSWSEGWGRHGNCVIPESAFGRDIGGFWVIRAVTETAGLKLKRTPFDRFTEYALAH
jgi:hypothetical protein